MKKLFVLTISLLLIGVVGVGIYINKDKILDSIPPAIEQPDNPNNNPGTETPGEQPGDEKPIEKPVSFGIELDNQFLYF